MEELIKALEEEIESQQLQYRLVDDYIETQVYSHIITTLISLCQRLKNVK